MVAQHGLLGARLEPHVDGCVVDAWRETDRSLSIHASKAREAVATPRVESVEIG
jgi:hypothetical protein